MFYKINDRQYGVILTDLNGVERYVRIGAIVAEEREDMTARELMESEVAKYNEAQEKKAEKKRKSEEKAKRDKALREKKAKEEAEKDNQEIAIYESMGELCTFAQVLLFLTCQRAAASNAFGLPRPVTDSRVSNAYMQQFACRGAPRTL